jgi:signal transduction histidine kinase
MKQDLRLRLTAGVVAIGILLACGAGLDIWNTRRTHEATDLVQRSEEVLRATSGVFALLLDAESSVRAFVLTGSAAFLAPYEENRSKIAERIDILQAATWDEPEQQVRVGRFQEMANARFDTMAELLALRRESPDPAAALPLIQKGGAQMAALRALAVQMAQAERESLDARRRRSDDDYVLAQASAALGLALGLLLIVVLHELLRRSLRVQGEATRLAEEHAAQLVEAARRKDEFLALLAHELRNPLAPIQSAVTLLREPELSQAQRRHMRDVIERQVRHLVRLVDDLLDVSRITQGKIELRRERLLLSAVVERAVETSRPVIEASGHELTVAASAEALVVSGDLVRLSQVVSNLLNNSAKFTPKGGHIGLALMRDGEQAVLRVRDDGAGIPVAMLSRVFEPFMQVDSRIERAQGGLGLGLSLAQRLVEMHGGAIEARSEGEGRGCEMIVRLPLAAGAAELHDLPDEPAAASFERGAARVEPTPHLRILIVDDSRDTAETLAETLEMLGHEVRM